jgi:hypothetical protein
MRTCDNCGNVRVEAKSAEVRVRVIDGQVGRVEVEAYPDLCGDCMDGFTRKIAMTVNHFSHRALNLGHVKLCRTATRRNEEAEMEDENGGTE